MKHSEKETERALEAALGKPKYYIDTEGKKKGERYFWFPTQGDSMTIKSPQSIPAGSLVLGRWLKITGIQQIPLHRPIVVIIDDNGKQFCILKCACKIITADMPEAKDSQDTLCLHSYNPRYEDFWLPYDCIRFVFVVERVRLADGSEFVP